ncbi:class I SAM-dependent methyltransferase [Natrialbaceae archaeon GCM10025810]|uniref:class I SAM-dependent methyltransferase n=1 Tax=Halovalidus salilacus TaxID=3075124 RepID=UPI003612F9E9
MTGEQSHPLFAALYDPVLWVVERTVLYPHRKYLVQDLDGRVLDLGAGTGAMFPLFDKAIESNRSIEFHAIEPDPHMQRRARDRADALDLDVKIRPERAESLPYPDDSFDVVIASMVFCTITDVDAAVGEVVRVLKPGGEFRFLEHVADDGWRRRVQDLLAPMWKRAAGGCHLTRRTPSTFVRAEAFDVIELERLSIGVTPVRPFVRGRFYRRRLVDSHPLGTVGTETNTLKVES